MDHGAQYRCIATFGSTAEAEVVRGLLESEGILVALLDAQVASLGLGPAVAQVQVLVPARDVPMALDLIGQPAEAQADQEATLAGLALPSTL